MQMERSFTSVTCDPQMIFRFRSLFFSTSFYHLCIPSTFPSITLISPPIHSLISFSFHDPSNTLISLSGHLAHSPHLSFPNSSHPSIQLIFPLITIIHQSLVCLHRQPNHPSTQTPPSIRPSICFLLALSFECSSGKVSEGSSNAHPNLPYVVIILLVSRKSRIPFGEDTSNCNL